MGIDPSTTTHRDPIVMWEFPFFPFPPPSFQVDLQRILHAVATVWWLWESTDGVESGQ